MHGWPYLRSNTRIRLHGDNGDGPDGSLYPAESFFIPIVYHNTNKSSIVISDCTELRYPLCVKPKVVTIVVWSAFFVRVSPENACRFRSKAASSSLAQVFCPIGRQRSKIYDFNAVLALLTLEFSDIRLVRKGLLIRRPIVFSGAMRANTGGF